MAGFQENDILNEIARILQSSVTPTRSAGVLDPVKTYQQMMDIATVSFLLHPDAIFYLAKLVSNKLLIMNSWETGIVEDMLVALEHVSNTTAPVTNSTDVSNARTAILALEGVPSAATRPEFATFIKNMGRFSNSLGPAVVHSADIAMSSEEAKGVLRRNLTSLKDTHSTLLSLISNLENLVENYMGLDIPSKVSEALISRFDVSLTQIEDLIAGNDQANILRKSKPMLLRSLVGTAIAKLVSVSGNASLVKYKGPAHPVPAGTSYYGRVTGDGIAASVTTKPGPWVGPLTDFSIAIDEGTAVTVPASTLIGASLSGRNKESFVISSDTRGVYVVVDPNTYVLSITSGGRFSNCLSYYVETDGFAKLGFKHLGTPVYFDNLQDWYSADAQREGMSYPRAITDFGILDSFSGSTWTPPYLDIVGASFVSEDVGNYIKDASGNRFEIVSVVSSTRVKVNTLGLLVPAGGAGTIRGSRSSVGYNAFEFNPTFTSDIRDHLGTMSPPDFQDWRGHKITIGPAVKATLIWSGTHSASSLVTALNSSGAISGAHQTTRLGWHVQASLDPSDPTKIVISSRSASNPFIRVSSIFQYIKYSVFPPEELKTDSRSFHQVVGFIDGEADSGTLVQTSELAGVIENSVAGVSTSVISTVIHEGVLSTVQGTRDIVDSAADFEGLVVGAGYQIVLESGAYANQYVVSARVSATRLTLTRDAFGSSEENIRYRVVSEVLVIASSNPGRGSAVQLVDPPSVVSSDETVHYGQLTTFEAVDRFGKSLDFSNAVAGDYLNLPAKVITIISVEGTILTLASALDSNVENEFFSVTSGNYGAYNKLKALLGTFTTSSNLLKMHKFDESLDALDNALSPIFTAGRGFMLTQSQAKTLLADLLSILTSLRKRSAEYNTPVPTASMNLADIVGAYEADQEPVVDDIISGFEERKHVRTVDLLLSGDIVGFFDTDYETSSYGGAVMAAARKAAQDLPDLPTSRTVVESEATVPLESRDIPDADQQKEADLSLQIKPDVRL